MKKSRKERKVNGKYQIRRAVIYYVHGRGGGATATI